MNEARPVQGGEAGDLATEHWPEPRAPMKGPDFDSFGSQLLAPGTGGVEATDRHWKLGPQASDEFDDQTLSAAGTQAQHDLQDAKGRPFTGGLDHAERGDRTRVAKTSVGASQLGMETLHTGWGHQLLGFAQSSCFDGIAVTKRCASVCCFILAQMLDT